MFGKKENNEPMVAKSLYSAVVTELDSAMASIRTLTKQVNQDKDTIEDLVSDKERLQAKYNQMVKDYELKLEAKDKGLNAKVNDALCSIGVGSFAVETITNEFRNKSVDISPVSAFEQFKQLSAEEQREFYKKHKDLVNEGHIQSLNVQS